MISDSEIYEILDNYNVNNISYLFNSKYESDIIQIFKIAFSKGIEEGYNEASQEDFDDEDDVYDKGYDEGYDQGYDKGYEDAKDEFEN